MTALLRPRPKVRMNVREPEQLVYQRHRKFVRTGKLSNCVVPNCLNRPLEFCHVRRGLPKGEQAGIGQKPHDCFGFAACHEHHIQDQHQHGERDFEKRHGVNLLQTALAYAMASPCPEVRAKAQSIRA